MTPAFLPAYSGIVQLLRQLAPLLVSLISLVVFLPALDGKYLNWDDPVMLLGNNAYRGLGWSHISWMFSTTLLGHYMPLTWLTFGLNYVAGGMNPWGYHLTNLILHAVNSALVYALAHRLLAAALTSTRTATSTCAQPVSSKRAPEIRVVAGAALAALLFAIHPQRAESVGWVTDRATVLSGLFYLLAVLGYLRAVDGDRNIRWRWAGLASLLAFAAALMSKGITVGLPISLLILDIYPLRRQTLGWLRLVAEKIPFIALALLGAVVTLEARAQGAQLTHYGHYDLGSRLALAAYSLWFYPSRLIWPAGLTPLYEHPLRASVLEWRFLGPAVAVAIVTVGLILLRRRFPGGLAAWVHSAVVVAPVSGIAHSGSQLVSDRYGYLAGLGLLTVLGYGFAWVLGLRERGVVRRWVPVAAVAGVALIVSALAMAARVQVYLWHDSETLWRWAVDKDSKCALCQAALGAAILEGSGGAPERTGEAESYLRRAIALRDGVAIAYAALGTIETDRGHDQEAETALRTYVRLSPQAADGPERLALLLLAQGRSAEALPLLRRARDLRRPTALAIPSPAVESMPQRGGTEFLQAVEMIGHNGPMLQYLGQILVLRGRGTTAIEPLRRAVALMPTAAGPRFWLVRAYSLAGDLDRAAQEGAVLQALNPTLAEIARPDILRHQR